MKNRSDCYGFSLYSTILLVSADLGLLAVEVLTLAGQIEG
jgi:hypothetical protein